MFRSFTATAAFNARQPTSMQRVPRQACQLLAGVLLVSSLLACQSKEGAPGDAPGSTPPAPAAAPPSAAPAAQKAAAPSSLWTDKAKFAGGEVFSIKPKDDGVKLVDGNEQELARYSLKEDLRVKAKSPDERVLAQVRGTSVEMRIEGPDKQSLFELHREANGNYVLARSGGKPLSHLRQEGSDWVVESMSTGTPKPVARVRREGKMLLLEEAGGGTLLQTKSATSALGMACLGLSDLDLVQRVALLVRMQAERL